MKKEILFIFLFVLASSCKKDPIIEYGTVTDIEGNTYKTVKTGEQEWMAENLRTSKYADGSEIPNVTDNTIWAANITGAYCDYSNNPSNSVVYGRLYNWYIASSTNPQNVCPTGWHVPTDDEWMILSEFLGGSAIAGGKLKEAGTTHWAAPNTGATNETGFSSLPSGGRPNSFCCLGNYGYYWCSYLGGSGAWVYGLLWEMSYSGSWTGHESNPLDSGWSIRCLKDY